MRRASTPVIAALVFGAVASAAVLSPAARAQKHGGTLTFVVPANPPSYDAHRETTFAVIHPLAPMYSLLIRVDPDNPSSPDFVCDLCEGDVPKPTENGTLYTFRIREGVKFHDGTPLTSADVKASLDKIAFPPEGKPSARRTYFVMVDSIDAPDPTTLTIKLKYPAGAFIPALGMPFNWIYSKKDLDTHGFDWHTQNVNGTGPFRFVEHVAGSHFEAKKYEHYHHPGQPYLDGFRATIAPKMSLRLQAIQGDRAAIEFRGFPPASRDDLVRALGDRITVQESDWNCGNLIVFNHRKKPFDDPRVRRALNLAVDRWKGSEHLQKIAIVKTVGGLVFPGHALAATTEELHRIEGYWPDIEKSRALARDLLKEAGQEKLTFALHNRAVDQPYKYVGTWLIDQWRQIGAVVKQEAVPTGPWYDKFRKTKDYDVGVDANCQSVVNPLVDISKFLCDSDANYTYCDNPKLRDLYEVMNREQDEAKQRTLMREFENEVYGQAHTGNGLWWYKINPYRSYVKGWKIAPSHYLNQQLDNVWIDKG